MTIIKSESHSWHAQTSLFSFDNKRAQKKLFELCIPSPKVSTGWKWALKLKKKSVTSLLNSLSVTLEKKLSTEKLPFEATFFEATFSTEIDIFWHPKSQSRSTLWAPFGDQSWRGCLSKGTVLEKRYIEFSQSFLILELTPNDFVIIRAFLSFESIVMLLKKIVKRPWLFYAKISGRNIIQKHEYLTWNARFRREKN